MSTGNLFLLALGLGLAVMGLVLLEGLARLIHYLMY